MLIKDDIEVNIAGQIIKTTRWNFLNTNFTTTTTCSDGLLKKEDITTLVESLENQLGLEADYGIHDNITEETLKTAAGKFLNLSFCPPMVEMDSTKDKLGDSIKIYSPKEILIIVNRLLIAKGENLPYKQEFSEILEKVRVAWGLEYQEIMKLTGDYECDTEDCKVSTTLIDQPNLSTVTNHPVHVLDEKTNISPSSLIPFCWFGDDLELKRKSERFKVSVCNNFQPKIRNNQVCYEMDPNQLLKTGQSANNIVLYLLIDENKDRQISVTSNDVIEKKKETFVAADVQQENSVIYLDTIGKISRRGYIY